MSTRNLALASFGPSGDEYRAVMAEFQLEGFSPGFALFVEGVNFVLVDVDAVDAAAHKTILMSVPRLADFLQTVLLNDASVKGFNLSCFAAARPVGLCLAEPVVQVVSEVPVAEQDGEYFALGRNGGSQSLDAVESLLLGAGREVSVPNIEISLVAT